MTFDYALVGGGLQSGLIALALLAKQPGIRIALIERNAQLGGNHTWCFHAQDVPPGAQAFVEPLVVARWPGYVVRFPNRTRTLASPYVAVSSERLHQVVAERVGGAEGCALVVGAEAGQVGAHSVTIGDGRSVSARVVVDARGPRTGVQPAGEESKAGAGYQKFLGCELSLRRPCGLDRALLMDATVPQQAGFRFFYVLPLAPERVLVEDTRFSDDPDLDVAPLRDEVMAYAERQGFDVEATVREETGVLPIPWTGEPYLPREGPLRAGYRGGWFHPATGYSFPIAVRLAQLVADLGPEHLFGDRLRRFADVHRRQVKYCHLLNRMLFNFFAPADRWHVFERFYRLPEPTIRRFYALQMTAADRARILVGRPPRGLSISYAIARREME